MMNFVTFKSAVAKQFAKMSKQETLFRVDVEGDDLWKTYLQSFPAGTDPMFKTRTEHDCNCCKQFIRGVGNVVAIIDNKLVSIWDVDMPDEPAYQVVANALKVKVTAGKVVDVFVHDHASIGTSKSFQHTVDHVDTWEHFYVSVPSKFCMPRQRIATHLGTLRTSKAVLTRAFEEIDFDSIDTVLELISQNSLYRGDEHKFAVNAFRKQKVVYAGSKDKDLAAWEIVTSPSGNISHIRNTVIGTLMTDIATGEELEKAVRSYESKVAPHNYKRPTALVTKSMVDKAKKTIEDLGLTSALERRYASLADVSVNNVIFANRDAKKTMGGDVFDDIASTTRTPKKMDSIEEISIDKFISDIVPRVSSIEILFENKHIGNLVSLVAPVDPTAKSMFKWNNSFSWAYKGDLADSIKERVKAAGGNVTGDVCCRLAWYNFDDLDLHMDEPGGGHVYFGSRGRTSSCGGQLDVDMNVSPNTRTPVENIFYRNIRNMKNGEYTLRVHQYTPRESKGVGFDVEIDIMGQTYYFSSKDNKTKNVAKLKKTDDGLIVKSGPQQVGKTAKHWGINTQEFHKVTVLMNSPNHWDGHGVGNKHFFFMLSDCINDENARGFFNEYLSEDLSAHRKVLEIVGSKMRTAETPNQLSGLGFSSTKRDSVTVRVTGAFTRMLKINF